MSTCSNVVDIFHRPEYNGKMVIRKAYRFKLKPRGKENKLFEAKRACDFVWNRFLHMNLWRLENGYSLLWYNEMSFWLTLYKRSEDYAFLKNVPSQALQQTLMDLDKAFKDGFDKTQPTKRIPTKRKRNTSTAGFRYPQGVKFEGNRVFLPKFGWIGYFNNRPIEGAIQNVTIKKQPTGWFMSVQVELAVADPIHSSKSIVGIDIGIAKFATLSNGDVINPINSLRTLEGKLARLQRKLAKKQRFSNNWKRLKQKISLLHHKIANVRRDFLQKESTKISKNHAMIVVEDLKISNMTRSAKGDIEQPGKNVKAKSGLNKSILDQGWSMFVDMLKYKQAWNGGDVLAVNPKHTSQTCPCCDHVSAENRKTQAEFECVECGHTGNADFVAATNILERGYRLLACGETGLPDSVKQEPKGSAMNLKLAA